MRRKTTLKSAEVTVTILVHPIEALTRDEAEKALDWIADRTAQAMASAWYVGCPLTRIKRKP